MKNREIVAFINGCAMLKEKKLPIKIGYAINRNIAILTGAAEAYNAEREKIIEEYAKKDWEGKPVIKNDCYVFEDQQAFNKSMEELFDIDTEVKLHKVSEKDIEKCDNPRYDALTVADLDTLSVMIE